MKHLKVILNALQGVFLGFFLTTSTPAWADESPLASMDSVEISLLTCEPHDEVYSLYGHTAIRYHDLRRGGIDVAFNYGVFNFHAPYFVLRFVFGITDYELGAYPYKYFRIEYERFGSQVVEQVLNLTNEEKLRLQFLLADNMQPANTVYRYNYFYNNCTTKARDIIEQCINGRIEYIGYKKDTLTYRTTVHAMTKQHPWARFGNDLLLGIKADRPTSQREQEFLPAHLMQDFDHALIQADGTRPLVKERRIAVPAGAKVLRPDFPLSPLAVGLILLGVGCIVFVIEIRKKKTFLWWDLPLMLLSGSLGIVLFLMLFSQHPTVSLNLQILLFNPLPWFFLWPVIKRRQTRYWHMTAILAVAFFVGAVFQCYAEGLWCLALCLLLQSYAHLRK